MNEESDLVAKIITNDINTLVEDLNNVIKAHNVLVNENEQLKERISKAQDFIRNESYLNDAEIDELCEILEGDK